MKKFLLFVLGVLLIIGSVKSQTPSTTYKIGDLYNQDGLKGIVVKVDSTGQHGLLMSLKASTEKWLDNKDFKFATNAFYDDNGEKNMQAIEKCIQDNNASWEDFPVFEWARSLGNGWYIPSRVEAREALINLKQAFNVNDNIFKTAKKLKKHLRKNGADKITYHMSHGSGFWTVFGWIFNDDLLIKDLITSTEKEGGDAIWLTNNNSHTKRMRLIGGMHQARAFHKF